MIKAYAALEPKGILKKIEYDPGELNVKEVEIDVKYCGICHSDLSMINNEWGISEYPLVPGHEAVGIVSKIGHGVKNVKLGDVVGLGWHAGYCNVCSSCNQGDNNLCSSPKSTIVGHHGAFADKVRADEKSVVIVPDGMDLEAVGPLFCGGITVFNPMVQYNIKPTDSVAVIGIGGLGHMAIQFLSAWGCKVTAFTTSEIKRKEALSLGAYSTLNSKSNKDIELAAGSFDYIISTVNVKLDWNLYLNALKPKGRLHIVGATLEPLDISAFSLIMGQRSISGSPVGSPENIKKMLEFAKLHNITPIIEKYRMEDLNDALSKLAKGDAHYRIVLQNDT